jgi:hypothetical protein
MASATSLTRLDGEAPGADRDDGARFFDPFEIQSERQRARHRAAYLRLLRERDGTLDFAGRRLLGRERALARLEALPVVWVGAVDREAFHQAFTRAGRPVLDRRTLWLIGISKANESESWGVEGEIQRFIARGVEDVDPCEVYVLLEENYHRRILAEACRTCGIQQRAPMPPAIVRWLIRAMQHMPGSIRYAPILCGEILGAVVFEILLERCDVFREQPEVEERLRTLVREILMDETCHVLYCRSRLGPLGLRVARALLPVVAAVFTRAIPQLLELGCSRRELLTRLRRGIRAPGCVADLLPGSG